MEAQVTTKPLTLAQLTEQVFALQERLAKLEEQSKPRNETVREMTDDDARNVLNGECKGLKHKDAAQKLGLSYGQVYSCRLEFTFKGIHKELKAAGYVNPWIKA